MKQGLGSKAEAKQSWVNCNWDKQKDCEKFQVWAIASKSGRELRGRVGRNICCVSVIITTAAMNFAK